MQLKNINKSYHIKKRKLHILRDINAIFEKGRFYAIMGRSGSGKSTLINILGMLDDYDEGEYIFNNLNVKMLSENEKARIRALEIGFVFQSFYLNNNLTALENVLLPTYINKNVEKCKRNSIAIILLKKMGLKDRINHKPYELSGGEQQRVAIARALVNNPSVIIADEPTGNLDEKNGVSVLEVLKKVAKDKLVIIVTHNQAQIEPFITRRIRLHDGEVVADEVIERDVRDWYQY